MKVPIGLESAFGNSGACWQLAASAFLGLKWCTGPYGLISACPPPLFFKDCSVVVSSAYSSFLSASLF